jgi:hypothetical protein
LPYVAGFLEVINLHFKKLQRANFAKFRSNPESFRSCADSTSSENKTAGGEKVVKDAL